MVVRVAVTPSLDHSLFERMPRTHVPFQFRASLRSLQWCVLVLLALLPRNGDSTTTASFRVELTVVDATQLRHSWHAGCPVNPSELRMITASHWGFDGRVHTGRIVVAQQHAVRFASALQALFDAHFPIERMEPIDAFQGDDHRSMEANNTSAFNCREVEGRPGVWSQHAYGAAIDLNPVQNPYVARGHVSPEAGRAFLDRTRNVPGLVRENDAAVRAFARIGWRWGGHWHTARDYQHFSANGR